MPSFLDDPTKRAIVSGLAADPTLGQTMPGLGDYMGHILSGLNQWASYPGQVAQQGAQGNVQSPESMIPWSANTAMSMAGSTHFKQPGGLAVGAGGMNAAEAANAADIFLEHQRQANRIAGGYTTPVYHGTSATGWQGREIQPRQVGGEPRKEFYTTGSPELAGMYAGIEPEAMKWHEEGVPQTPPYGSQVLPMYLNRKGYHEVDAEGDTWDNVNYEDRKSVV